MNAGIPVFSKARRWRLDAEGHVAGVECNVEIFPKLLAKEGIGHKVTISLPVVRVAIGAMPADVCFFQKVFTTKKRMAASPSNHFLTKAMEVAVYLRPVKPIELVVLAPAIVVTVLCVAVLIAHVEHGHAL